MPDWLVVINAWAAVPLTVAGFWAAIYQIKKTRTAAEAAQSASEQSVGQVGGNLLLVVLPQLVQIESNLEWAVARQDRDVTIHYLSAWRWQAGQVRGHLSDTGEEHEEFLVQLQTSIATAADTKLSLQDPSADVAKRAKAVQKAIAVVTGTIGELSVRRTFEGVVVDGR